MIPREILKKIRQIELRTNRIVTETLAGQYHSVFKGQGMNFDEVREYASPATTMRAIDWNVTARMNHPFVKKFVEERELTPLLVVWIVSAGRGCSARATSPARTRCRDRLGARLLRHPQQRQGRPHPFSDEVDKFVPAAQRSQSRSLRVIREVLFFEPKRRRTNKKVAFWSFFSACNRTRR